MLTLEGFTHASSLDLKRGIIIPSYTPETNIYVLLYYHGEITSTKYYLWGFVTAPISSRNIYTKYLRGLIC